MCQMTKMATLGVGVTSSQSCYYGYQSADVSIFLKLVVYWALPSAVLGPNLGLLLWTLSAWASYKLLDSLEMKANFNPFFPYFSLHIPLRSLYCISNCSDMLLWSTVIQITHIQLSTNIHFWGINWKPHIEIFPERPPCIHAIWLTEVKSYNSRTAITHFLTPGTHT